MSHKNCGEFDVTVAAGHYEEYEEPATEYFPARKSRRWVRTGDATHKVRLEIYFEAIIRNIGASAIKNKSGISKYLAGAVIARRIS